MRLYNHTYSFSECSRSCLHCLCLLPFSCRQWILLWRNFSSLGTSMDIVLIFNFARSLNLYSVFTITFTLLITNAWSMLKSIIWKVCVILTVFSCCLFYSLDLFLCFMFGSVSVIIVYICFCALGLDVSIIIVLICFCALGLDQFL